MYGYTQTGLEKEGQGLARLTNVPIPLQFQETIIPSLLFGSLISATDPGTYTHTIIVLLKLNISLIGTLLGQIKVSRIVRCPYGVV